LKVAATIAFIGTVISDTVASNRGIGNLMMIASSSFDVPLVFAGLFIMAALGVALYVIFSLIGAVSPAGRCAAANLRPAASSSVARPRIAPVSRGNTSLQVPAVQPFSAHMESPTGC
jgi:hypothetical protein